MFCIFFPISLLAYLLRHSVGSLNEAADIATIIGVIGLGITVWEYFRRKTEERRRAVKSIWYQLGVMRHWTGYLKGGYPSEKKREVIEGHVKNLESPWGKPFGANLPAENSALNNLSLLPAITYLPDEINKAIAYLNQSVMNFNSYLLEIRDFKNSRGAIKNIALLEKLEKKETLDKEEGGFRKILIGMYATLHYDLIGGEGDKNEAFYHWHKKLTDSLIKGEKYLDGQ